MFRDLTLECLGSVYPAPSGAPIPGERGARVGGLFSRPSKANSDILTDLRDTSSLFIFLALFFHPEPAPLVCQGKPVASLKLPFGFSACLWDSPWGITEIGSVYEIGDTQEKLVV